MLNLQTLPASVAVMMTSVVCALAAIPVLAQEPNAGLQIAERLCAPCHAIKSGAIGQHPMAPRFEDIPKRYSVWDLSEALAEGILVGHASMPKFKLEAKEIHELLTYMDTFAKPSKNTR